MPGPRSAHLVLIAVSVALLVVACARPATQLPPPTVAGISPDTGAPHGGTPITITGTNFFQAEQGGFPGSLSVTICGVVLQNTQVQGTVRNITLPGGARTNVTMGNLITGITGSGESDGTGDVIVHLPDGRSATLAGAFSCDKASTEIVSFGVEPTEAGLGETVTFAWQIESPAGTHVDCSLDPGTGTAIAVADCAPTGTLQHAYSTVGSYAAILTVEPAGASEAVTAETRVVIRIPAPLAVDDAYSAPVDAPVTVPAPGVLANDTPNGGIPTAATSSEGGGMVALSPDGSFTYRAAPGFTGADTFTYTLSNDAGSDTATVTVTVGMAPEASDDHFVTGLNTPLVVAAPGLLANDVPNGSTLTHDASSQEGGTVVVDPDGSFTYVPAPGFVGTDEFGYTLTNGNGTATARVTIGVNSSPQALDDHFATAVEATLSVIAPGLLANDAGVPAPTVTERSGTTTEGGSYQTFADGAFTYMPTAGFVGSDTFGYEISSAAGTANAVVHVTVGDAPIAVADSLSSAQDESLVIPFSSLLANDLVNGATFSLQSAASEHGGTVNLVADTVTYSPPGGFTGDDSFTYLLLNPLGSSQAQVTITVFEAPVAVADIEYSTDPGQLLSVSAANGVLANDTGIPAPVAVADTSTTPSGTFTLAADGSFTFQPAPGFTGNAKFSYTATNIGGSSTAEVRIAVGTPASAVDDQLGPVLGNVYDQYLIEDLLANDAGDLLDFSSVSSNSSSGGTVQDLGNGSILYTPPAGYTGPDFFTYEVSNGFGASTATVHLTVTGLIWFLDSVASGPGDGSLASPFQAVSQLPALKGDEVVFFHEGSYSGSIHLVEGTRLIGQSASGDLASLAGVTWPSGAAQPILNGPTSGLIPLALGSGSLQLDLDNHIHGLALSGTSSAVSLLHGTDFGTVTVSDVALHSTDRAALNLEHGNAAAYFSKLDASGSTAPFVLTEVGGHLSVNSGSISTLSTTNERCTRVTSSGTADLLLELSEMSFDTCHTGLDIVVSGNATVRISLQDLDVRVRNGAVNLYATDDAEVALRVLDSELVSTVPDNNAVGFWAVSEDRGSVVVQIADSDINGAAFGLYVVAREGGGASADLTMTGSKISAVGAHAYAGLVVDSGNGTGGEAVAVCMSVSGNEITAASAGAVDAIVIDQYAGNMLRIPGYEGASTDHAALASFLSSTNNAASTTVAAEGLDVTGGAPCALPDLTGGG